MTREARRAASRGAHARGARPRSLTAQASSTRSAAPTEGARAIYSVVLRIPRGKVATYGEVAALAGIPAGHRVAARAMRSCPEHLPWQRVVGKKDARRAQVNIDDPEHAAMQRAVLESEGVVFDHDGFIPLAQCGWLAAAPRSTPRARPAAAQGRAAAKRRVAASEQSGETGAAKHTAKKKRRSRAAARHQRSAKAARPAR